MALRGVRVLELAGLAPGPFCGMILADFGATVIRIDKAPFPGLESAVDSLSNGKMSFGVNLKHPAGVDVFKKLSRSADVIVEPFRAGVMEKLGLGPKVLMDDNKRLIYARLTGYGQEGPMARAAGHDINYISLSGVLSMLGWRGEAPTPPINIAADFGGGGLMCALGIVMALYERSMSGKGQVVDADMMSGSAYLSSWLFRSRPLPIWTGERGTNVLDGGSHYYDTYKTSDGRWMAVGSIEPKFYDALLQGLGLSEDEAPQNSESSRALIKKAFESKSSKHWVEVFNKLDACVTLVLTPEEAAAHEQTKALKSFVPGTTTPNPAPRLSRTPAQSCSSLPSPNPGEHTAQLLSEIGYSNNDIKQLSDNGVILLASSDLSAKL